MRILVTNDDGIDAPGLALLREAALRLSDDVWTVAPSRKWTAASHHLSFDRTLTLEQRGERLHACSGTPADCVVAALTLSVPGRTRPDLVLSGINDGENIGEDAIYSGTIAAAREATFADIPAMALSQPKHRVIGSDDASRIADLIGRLWAKRGDWTPDRGLLSVNLAICLPATVAVAAPGRAKIASEVEVTGSTGPSITFRLSRKRRVHAVTGDQASALAAGQIVVTRLSAVGTLPFDLGGPEPG